MPISKEVKEAIAFKKAVGTSHIGDGVEYYEERTGSFTPSLSRNVTLSNIPTTKAQAISSGVGIEVTLKLDEVLGSVKKGWKKNGINNFIDPGLSTNPLGSGYAVEIFEDDGGGSPDFGKPIALTDVIKPFFDYQGGVLSFEAPTARVWQDPPHIRAVQYIGKKLTSINISGTPQERKAIGKSAQLIDGTTNPEFGTSLIVDSVMANGYVWCLGSGVGGFGTTKLFAVGIDNKKAHPEGPFELLISGSPGSFFARNMTYDGEKIWVVATPTSGPGAVGYLWSFNTITLEQEFFDLTEDPGNTTNKAVTIFKDTGPSILTPNGLDVIVYLDEYESYAAFDTITLSGFPVSATIAEIAAFLNDPSNGKTLAWTAVAGNNAVMGDYLFIYGDYGVKTISADGSLFGYKSRIGPGRYGSRYVEYEGRNRNLWIGAANRSQSGGSPTVRDTKGTPFIFNVDSKTSVTDLSKCVVEPAPPGDVLSEGIFGGMYTTAGKYACMLFNGSSEILTWDVDTQEAIYRTSTHGRLKNADIISDGKFVYSHDFKYDPTKNLITHVDRTSPSLNGPLVLTHDALWQFSDASKTYKVLSKSDYKIIQNNQKIGDPLNFVGWSGSGFYPHLAFDGSDIWVTYSTTSSPLIIDQIPADMGTSKEVMRREPFSDIDAKIYELPQTAESLKQSGDFVAKARIDNDNDTFSTVQFGSRFLITDLGMLSVFGTNSGVPSQGKPDDSIIKHLNLFDLRSSRHDDILAGANQRDGSLANDFIDNGAGTPTIALRVETSGDPAQYLLRPILHCSGMALDNAGNLFLTDDGRGTRPGNLVVVNTLSTVIQYQDYQGDFPDLAVFPVGSDTSHPVIFGNVSDSYAATPQTYCYVLNKGDASIWGFKLDPATNTIVTHGGDNRGLFASLSASGTAVNDEPYPVLLSDLGHSGGSTPQAMDKFNEFLVIADESSVFLFDVVSYIDASAPVTRLIDIPTSGATALHCNQSSIFVGQGTQIEEWKFEPSRLMYDQFASVATNQVTFSDPISNKIAIGDIIHAPDLVQTGVVTNIVATTPNGIVDTSGSLGDGVYPLEVYKRAKSTFATGFTNVKHMTSSGGFLYIYDEGSVPYNPATPPTLHKYDIGTQTEVVSWRKSVDLNPFVFRMQRPDFFFVPGEVFPSAHNPGSVVTLDVHGAITSATVRVYGQSSGSPVFEDITAPGGVPTDGVQAFDQLFGSRVISTTPAGIVPVGNDKHISLLDDFAQYTMELGLGNVGGSAGNWFASEYPMSPESTNEAYGKIVLTADGGNSEFYIKGKDLGGSPVQEIILSDTTGVQTANAYSEIEVILKDNNFQPATARIQRPSRILDLKADGNHLIAYDGNNHIFIKELL